MLPQSVARSTRSAAWLFTDQGQVGHLLGTALQLRVLHCRPISAFVRRLRRSYFHFSAGFGRTCRNPAPNAGVLRDVCRFCFTHDLFVKVEYLSGCRSQVSKGRDGQHFFERIVSTLRAPSAAVSSSDSSLMRAVSLGVWGTWLLCSPRPL